MKALPPKGGSSAPKLRRLRAIFANIKESRHYVKPTARFYAKTVGKGLDKGLGAVRRTMRPTGAFLGRQILKRPALAGTALGIGMLGVGLIPAYAVTSALDRIRSRKFTKKEKKAVYLSPSKRVFHSLLMHSPTGSIYVMDQEDKRWNKVKSDWRLRNAAWKRAKSLKKEMRESNFVKVKRANNG